MLISLAAIDCYTQVHVKWRRKMLQVTINFVVYAMIEYQEIK